MNNNIELLDCPFCGIKPVVTKHFKIDEYGLIHRCKLIGPIVFEFSGMDSIANSWNTRVIPDGATS